MKFVRQQAEQVDVNLTPLIDVVFLLLIFFMVSTTFTKETRINLALPQANGEPVVAETEQVEISITKSGDYAVNGKVLVNNRRSTLRAAISDVALDHTDRPLVISADAQAPHQSVVTAMDVAGKLGFENVRIATQVPERE